MYVSEGEREREKERGSEVNKIEEYYTKVIL